jgi:hypothetical protein
MGEHAVYTREAPGSSPGVSTPEGATGDSVSSLLTRPVGWQLPELASLLTQWT